MADNESLSRLSTHGVEMLIDVCIHSWRYCSRWLGGLPIFIFFNDTTPFGPHHDGTSRGTCLGWVDHCFFSFPFFHLLMMRPVWLFFLASVWAFYQSFFLGGASEISTRC